MRHYNLKLKLRVDNTGVRTMLICRKDKTFKKAYRCLKMKQGLYKGLSFFALYPEDVNLDNAYNQVKAAIHKSGGILVEKDPSADVKKTRPFPEAWIESFDSFTEGVASPIKFLMRDVIPSSFVRGTDYDLKEEVSFKYWLTTKRGCVKTDRDTTSPGYPVIYEYSVDNDPEKKATDT